MSTALSIPFANFEIGVEHFLELSLIVWATWRPLRAVLSPSFAVAYPSVARKLRVVFSAFALLTTVLFLFVEFLLHLAALGAAVFIVAERWRARPSWGCRRRLPPGSLGIFPNIWRDDRFYLKESSKHGPIFKTSNFLRPIACIVGLERGLKLLRDYDDRLETPMLPFAEFVPGGLLRYMRDPEHCHYRAVLRSAVSPQRLKHNIPALRATTRRVLSVISTDSASATYGVAPSPYLDDLMFDLWLPLFFAIEPASEQGGKLRSLYSIIDIDNPTGASPEKIRSAVRAISAIVEGQLDRWRGSSPPHCLLGNVMAASEADARDPVVIGNLLYLLHTSSTDMSGLLCWLLKIMSYNPDWLERLAAKSRLGMPTDSSSLATRVVMETLRMRQSEFLYRAVSKDIEFEGFRIPKGWLLRICIWESHRDPTVFDEPDRFDPDRFLGRSYSRSEYLPFGALGHACLAAQLATLVGSIFVSELANGFHLHTLSAGSVELGGYRHWRPNRSYRIRLQAQQ